MFTMKQRLPDRSEFIAGPFDSVEMVRDNEKPTFWVVRGLKDPQGQTYQAGPYPDPRKPEEGQPIVWVMNEAGATVARYLL